MKGRLLVIKILLIIMLILIIAKLYNLQIINGAGYKNLSDQHITANITKKAPRGEILDCNGKVLVTNRKGYTVKIQKTKIDDSELNAVLLNVNKILQGEANTEADTLPISYSAPYKFLFPDKKEKKTWFDENSGLKSGMTADEVMDYYKKAYKLEEFSEEDARFLAGIRYDMRKSGFSINTAYTIASDVSIETVSKIKERSDELSGVVITEEYFREYANGSIASHILGRVGKIYKEEYEDLKKQGYGLNDLVGKEGIEKNCEAYLRGKDGSKSAFYGKDADLLGDALDIDAVPGNYVVLTLDSELQETAEKSLEKNIKRIVAEGVAHGGTKRGADANAGAAVVIDIKNGDILAMANYPTFDLNTYSEKYNDLMNDPAKPLWNRAISGTYTPGSTFKPLTAIAALSTGAISKNEHITCEGVYQFYEDYQPKCWIWSEQHTTHGSIDVSRAIVDSCNYFFYETGRRTGIDAISEYANKFGLGKKTGVELSGEVGGSVATPEYKKTLYKKETDKKWVAGDTIQTAIGQSFSNFTPIGLANYAATIANGGTRYKPHIIKSVRSSTDGTPVVEEKTVISENVGVSNDIMDVVKKGMLGVTDEGSAKAIFEGYPIEVGGKTGTAQISKNSSNNALFVSFAPFDKPEIAVCVVIEHGYRGANAAYVARDIYDKYFNLNKSEDDVKEIDEQEDFGEFAELLR